MKKIGVIGIPGKWSSEIIADALEKKTGYRLLISTDDINLDLSKKRAYHRGVDLSELDGIIIKKIGDLYSHHMLDRLEVLNYLNHNGLKIFSNPLNIKKAVDRLSCTVELSKASIPMPETVITESVEEANLAVRRFGKAVLKPLFTSKARGMKVVEIGADTLAQIQVFKAANNPVMYIQKMLNLQGKDLGIVFLGGKYIGTYARVIQNSSWTTTTHFGGAYTPYDPSEEIIELAERAQSVFGLDFTCVDVAETPEGPIVFEVSAFGGFRGLMEARRIDAAELYAEYVIEKLAD